jgi:hypothetical protein
MNKEQQLYDDNVTRQNIERAITDLRGYSDSSGYAKTRRSTIYCMEVDANPRHLPPKVVITRSANMCSGTNSLQESSVVGRNMRMESSKGLASANRSNAAGPGAVAGSVKRNNSLNEANRRIKSPCFVPGEDSLSKDEQARIRVARTSRGFLTGTETQGRAPTGQFPH